MFSNSPNSERLYVLTSIWKRAFQRERMGPNDNFLSIGGTSEIASLIAAEITAFYGREISPLLVLQASTISSLAEVLAKTELPAVSPILPLNDSSQGPPIFMAHGIGDTIVNLLPLASRLQSSFAIYGMQAPGVDGVQEPLNRIEKMAEYHLAAVRQVQPHGPYFLVGYSMGGLVVLEMARSLSEASEEIGLVAMLDSYPYRRYFPLGQRIRWELSQTRRRSADLWRRIKALALQPRSKDFQLTSRTLAAAMMRTRDAQYQALRTYRPRYYKGEVRFVRAAIASYFPADPTPIWRRLVGELFVEVIPGNHLEMLNAQVEALASLLRCLLPQTLGTETTLKLVV